MKWAAAIALVFMGFVGAGEPTTTTLTGSYIWTRAGDKEGDLKAVFTAKSDNEYSVSFYFKFEGVDHVYSGTAKGSLKNGELAGEVKDEKKEHTFTFAGMCKEGAFSGTHHVISEKGENKTGTLTLTTL